MSNYFGEVNEQPVSTVKPEQTAGLRLPPKREVAAPQAPAPVTKEALDKVGKAAGFVSRQPKATGRRPGPKRTEPQGKITVTGPQRVIDALQARSDAKGGVPYWQIIEELLDATE